MNNQYEAVRYAVKQNQRSGCFDFWKKTRDGRGLLQLAGAIGRVGMLELMMAAGLLDLREVRIAVNRGSFGRGVCKVLRKFMRIEARKQLAMKDQKALSEITEKTI